MRTIPASLAALGLIAVSLVGCSAPGVNGCTRPDSGDAAVLDAVTVDGPAGSAPDVEVYTPFHASSAAFDDLVVGDGTPIVSDGQVILMDLTITSGETGEKLFATGYDDDLAATTTVSQWLTAVPAFEDALHCAAEGARIVVAIPPSGLAEGAAASLEMGADDSAIAVLDLRKVFLPKAEGAEQFNVQRGVPSVVRAPDGRPGIIVPDAQPPADVVVQTLIEGNGPEVTGDEPVRVQYTGVTWADRKVFDTTWDDGPTSIDLSTMLPAFADAVIGASVGSQVMIVIPPDQGYGAQGQGPIPADSTLVFVVDILGVDQVPSDR